MDMDRQFWAACRTYTGREHAVRGKLEVGNRGAFLPTYVRSYISGGRLSVAERAAVPGYVFFLTTDDDWPPVQNIDGVIGVLTAPATAAADRDSVMRISVDEMARMVFDHADGSLDRFEVGTIYSPSRRGRRKSRKPRPSKRARFK